MRYFIAIIMTFYMHILYAQQFNTTENNPNTDSVSKTLSTFRSLAKNNSEIASSLSNKEKQLAIVFIPGILGSKLTSSDGSVIFGDLSDYNTLISRLELPESLIDENNSSDVSAELLLNLAHMDLYGDAIGPMKSWANAHNVQFVTCGYDWRRDIRAGAQDLEKCLQNEWRGEQPKNIVIIAHSMGGLVTWNWMKKHESGHFSPNLNVISIAILGSPLQGSCEIVRMIQSGYIQPTHDDSLKISTDLKPLKSVIDKWVDGFVNYLSGKFTQGIRPLVLSWPGAIELTPPPSTASGKISCVGLPAEGSPIGAPSISYYNPQFWSSIAGSDMLMMSNSNQPYSTPRSLSMVLKKAEEFRTTFKIEKLKSPVFLYYSQTWLVPSEAGLKYPHIGPANQWSTTWGDGRVPYTSAMVSDNPTVYSFIIGVDSVHGNLPADPNFYNDFFNKKLPRIFNATLTNELMKEALKNPQWLAAYAKVSNVGPESSQLHDIFELQAKIGNESDLLKMQYKIAEDFTNRICSFRNDCVTDYHKAKKLKASSANGGLVKITQYSAVAKSLGVDHPNFVYAEGNKGLMLAKNRDWGAASISLQHVSNLIDEKNITSEITRVSSDEKYTQVIDANLGKSLYESGDCKAAEPYLRKSTGYWVFAREALAKPCNDVLSGLQYCFDSHEYCRNHN